MPTFEFKAPDGKTYSVDGPDGATPEQAFKMLQTHLGSAAAPSEPAAAPEKPSAISDVAMQAPTGFNEGLADTVGAPVDAMSWALRKAGLPIPTAPFGGSQSIKNGLGYIDANPDNAPAQTPAGQIMRSATAAVPATVLPEAGLASLAKAGVVAPKFAAPAQALLGDGSSLGTTAAAGAASGAGSEVAGQAAQGTPFEPVARAAGGMAAGGLAGALAARMAARPLQAMPTADAVDAEKTALYNDPSIKNLLVNPRSVRLLGDQIDTDLQRSARFPEDHAPVFTQVNRLSSADQPVSFDELDAVRKRLGELAGQTNEGRSTPTAGAAGRAREMLSDFLDNTMLNNPAHHIVQGDPVAARATMQEARATAGAGIRSDQVTGRLDNANIDAASANSGMNVANRIRQTLKPLLKNDGAKIAGYTPDERAALNNLVRGSATMNVLRHVGNAIGGSGISILPGAYIGHATLGAAGTALPAAGWALKTLANHITQAQAQRLSNQLLARAPISQRVAAQNATIRVANTANRNTLARQAATRAALASSMMKANGN